MKTMRVLIMAGGTGGHVFPALALAEKLIAQGIEVHWLGTSTGFEAEKIFATSIPFHSIPMQGVRGKSWKIQIRMPWRLIKSTFIVWRLIKKLNISAVFGFGGFVTAPGGLAAFLSGKSLYLHEQNAVMGTANRYLSYFAKYIFTGFPNISSESPKIKYVGNPVRESLLLLPTPDERFARLKSSPRLRILVLGGSSGAQAINQLIPRMLQLFPEGKRPEIWHQSGKKHFLSCEENYKKLGLLQEVRISPFIDNMPEAYLWADLVICRAGALTLAEIAAVGLASILIPFPFAVDDHQNSNAKHFVDARAALCEQEKTLTPERLAYIVSAFLDDASLCLRMANAAFEFRRTHVVDDMISIAGGIKT